MQIHDDIRQTVLFVASKKLDYQISATGFFASHHIEGTDFHQPYIVTAKHVVENATELSDDGAVHLRLNVNGRPAVWRRVEPTSWVFHDDLRIDIAISSVDWDARFFNQLAHKVVPATWCLSNDQMAAAGIFPGADLFFPGLFTRHHGDESNIPILRVGTIAALPQERLPTSSGMARMLLAEIRSIGGHSGSPVFVKEQRVTGASFTAETRLIGVVSGFFPLKRDQFGAYIPADKPTASADFSFNVDFNSGIAAVVPADDVLAVFQQSALVEHRRKHAERIQLGKWEELPAEYDRN